MFGEQFYPTPIELAKRCIQPFIDDYLHVKKYAVLDPSAGSGAFLDAYIDLVRESVERSNDEHEKYCQEYKKEHGRFPNHTSWHHWDRIESSARSKCFAIEIDGDLQSILLGKNYSVIDSDFLNHSAKRHYNLVIMNPPFRNGAKHLLHAWETVSFDDLVCILNAETIRNPHSFDRQKLVSIIEENAFSVEYEQAAFSDADRKTNVEIAIIRMNKKVNRNLFDDVDTEVLKERKLTGDQIPDINALAKPDVIGNLVQQYEETIKEYVQYRRAVRRMKQYEDLFDWYTPEKKLIADDSPGRVSTYKKDDQADYQDFIERLTQAAWNTVFRLTNMEGKMTKAVKEQFEKNRSRVGTMAFNESNIYDILELLMQNAERMLIDCILEVFDTFTKYHKENRVYFEGWKTNDAYEVGSKVILPSVITRQYGKIELTYYKADSIRDIDKALCFVSGKQYHKVDTIEKSVKRHSQNVIDGISKLSGLFESEFFFIRVYGKGTIHLKFKDEKVRQRFNQIPAKERGWLKAWQNKHAGGQSVILHQ